MISIMARRGTAQNGRTGVFDPEATVTVTVRYRPGDADRPGFERLVTEMGISAAEVMRLGVRKLLEERDRRPWTTTEEPRIAS